jgi:serine/threonine protein phosphatase PrpC
MVVFYAVASSEGAWEAGSDAGYASSRLLVVASGGGTCGDAVAGTVIDAFRACDVEVVSDELGETLDAAICAVRARLRNLKRDRPVLADTSVSFAVMLWSGHDLALANLGDAAAFMLRDAEMFQITEDNLFHGWCDINPWWHPTSLRALEDKSEVEIKVFRRTATMCDRYLLCTGGLLGAVPVETLYGVLMAEKDRARAAERLLDLANRHGGPDNLTCVVADIIPGPSKP